MHRLLLAGRAVLVVEDEYMIADDLKQALQDEGAEVIGPVPTVAQALALIEGVPKIDVAVLDANLGGERAWPIADALANRAIPFLFVTGYEAKAIPAKFHEAIRLEKPVDAAEVVRTSGGLLA